MRLWKIILTTYYAYSIIEKKLVNLDIENWKVTKYALLQCETENMSNVQGF